MSRAHCVENHLEARLEHLGYHILVAYAYILEIERLDIEAALSDALYLTAVERNADVVAMTSYAPLHGAVPTRCLRRHWHTR